MTTASGTLTFIFLLLAGIYLKQNVSAATRANGMARGARGVRQSRGHSFLRVLKKEDDLNVQFAFGAADDENPQEPGTDKEKDVNDFNNKKNDENAKKDYDDNAEELEDEDDEDEDGDDKSYEKREDEGEYQQGGNEDIEQQQEEVDDEEDHDKDEDNMKHNKDDDNVNENIDETSLTESTNATSTVTWVKLPDFFLELGFETTSVSRTSDNDYTPAGNSRRDRPDAVESVVEEYFESSLPKDVMGSNHIDCEVTVTTAMSDRFGYADGGVLTFDIKGECRYQGESVPKQKDLEDRLKQYFSYLGATALESHLRNQGIVGAVVTQFYVEDTLVAATDLPAVNTTLAPGTTVYGIDSTPASTEAPSLDSSITTTETSNNAATKDDAGSNPTGLITGLTLFFICIFLAAILIYNTREQLSSECGKCWRSTRDGIRQKTIEKRGWHDMKEEEERSNTTQDNDDSAGSPTSSPVKSEKTADREKPSFLRKMASRFQRKDEEERDDQEIDTSDHILKQIQVLVDDEHILSERSPGYNRSIISATEASGQQYSTATVPHGNHAKQVNRSPSASFANFTMGMEASWVGSLPSDEESLEDPIVRYAPPTRSQSPIYQNEKRHIGNKKKLPPTTPETCACSPTQTTSTPSAVVEEDEDDWWATFNPCRINLPMFKYESERLDDLVANIPRDKSLVDADISTSSSPSPPRYPNPNQYGGGDGRSPAYGAAKYYKNKKYRRTTDL